jgi:hypothetical protein
MMYMAGTRLKSFFNSWDEKTKRLDSFYAEILTPAYFPDGFQELKSVITIKLVLILSSGNAAVESGFSINKNLLVENLSEQSLISRRV